MLRSKPVFFHTVTIRLTENTKYYAKHLSAGLSFALLSAWSFLWSRIAHSLGWPFSKTVSCCSSIVSRKSQLTSVQLSETTPLLNEPFIASYLIVWLIKAANQRDSHIQEQGYVVLNSEMLKSFKRIAWQQLCSAQLFLSLKCLEEKCSRGTLTLLCLYYQQHSQSICSQKTCPDHISASTLSFPKRLLWVEYSAKDYLSCKNILAVVKRWKCI